MGTCEKNPSKLIFVQVPPFCRCEREQNSFAKTREAFCFPADFCFTAAAFCPAALCAAAVFFPPAAAVFFPEAAFCEAVDCFPAAVFCT